MLAVDLFCGAGGAAIGLKRAGFTVIGIDIKRPSRYYGDILVLGDVRHPPVDIGKADFLFASPPCQAYSRANGIPKPERGDRYKDYISITRNLFRDHPWTAIENVEDAPLRQDLILYGANFGLGRLRRKRIFELSFFAWNLPAAGYTGKTVPVCNGTPTGEYKRREAKGEYPSIRVAEKLEVMGLSEYPMRNMEVANAVPPPYTEYIGREGQARMREAGYQPQKHTYWREALREVEYLTEVPF